MRHKLGRKRYTLSVLVTLSSSLAVIAMLFGELDLALAAIALSLLSLGGLVVTHQLALDQKMEHLTSLLDRTRSAEAALQPVAAELRHVARRLGELEQVEERHARIVRAAAYSRRAVARDLDAERTAVTSVPVSDPVGFDRASRGELRRLPAPIALVGFGPTSLDVATEDLPPGAAALVDHRPSTVVDLRDALSGMGRPDVPVSHVPVQFYEADGHPRRWYDWGALATLDVATFVFATGSHFGLDHDHGLAAATTELLTRGFTVHVVNAAGVGRTHRPTASDARERSDSP